ncbi:DoxX protein [Dyadobacter soli]|uniref:DoxX protein n=1 Tax=Dyadobacter soli TaxID=659014 RepID=A0A1G7GCB0_9BACT|nr:DoxX family membrane protein [Dyadobacter soli]SDE85725.1 DoxX protein [Dyadobacter soli]
MANNTTPLYFHQLFLRIALAVALLSAVADRFGMWPDQVSAWGNWENFEAYTRKLTFFLPEILSKASGYVATAAEIVLGLLLLAGFQLRWTGLFTALLLATFALSMTFALGIKAPFDYSVWVGSAGAFMLAGLNGFPARQG